jgi:hypothetical protein
MSQGKENIRLPDNNPEKYAFIIRNIFTQAECKELINKAIAAQFKPRFENQLNTVGITIV